MTAYPWCLFQSLHISAAGSALPDAHTGIMTDLIIFPLSASMFSKYQEIDIITKILIEKERPGFLHSDVISGMQDKSWRWWEQIGLNLKKWAWRELDRPKGGGGVDRDKEVRRWGREVGRVNWKYLWRVPCNYSAVPLLISPSPDRTCMRVVYIINNGD